MLCKSEKPPIILLIMLILIHVFSLVQSMIRKKNDATRVRIKEAGRMNHLKHSVPQGLYHPVTIRAQTK